MFRIIFLVFLTMHNNRLFFGQGAKISSLVIFVVVSCLFFIAINVGIKTRFIA